MSLINVRNLSNKIPLHHNTELRQSIHSEYCDALEFLFEHGKLSYSNGLLNENLFFTLHSLFSHMYLHN